MRKINYWVHVDEGSAGWLSYGPHSLKSAKDYARISSSKGFSDRFVTRGRDGRLVRIYSKGVRVFPEDAGDLGGFYRSEVPRRMV